MLASRFWTAPRLYLAGGAVAFSIVIGLLLLPPHLRLSPAAGTSALALVFAVMMAFAGAAWRRTDEAAREAHKVAAIWGSSFGLLLSLVSLAGLARFAATPQAWRHSVAALFSGNVLPEQLVWMLLGAMLVGLAASAGYLMTWAGWWLRNPAAR